MFQKKLKTVSSKSFIALVLPSALLLPALVSLFFPNEAYAAITNVSAQRDRTILHALYRCLNDNNDPHLDGNFANYVTGEDVRRGNISGMIGSGDFNGEAAVGYEIDETDGNANCDQMSLTRAMRPIGKNPRWFFNQFYDLSHGEDLGDQGFQYPYREGVTSSSVLAKIHNLMAARDLGVGRDERLRRLAVAFWVCAEAAPNPPDGETNTFNGKKYQLREDAPGEVSVGYDIPTGDDENGKFECNTLLKWGDKNEMEAALRGHPEGTTPGGGGQGAGGDESVNDIDCSGGGALGWIICPVFELGANMTQDVFDNIIRPMMEQVPVNTKGPFYAAWNNFRFLGNIVLIGAMLALVYAQARGGGR